MTAAEMDIIVGANVDQAVASFKKLGYTITQTEQKAGKASGKMGKDFTGLSRVIQDLPYGFNAISNNLTQLLPAAGAAGLAFSAITTAITFAQIGFSAWTRGIGESKKELSAYNDEMSKTTASANTEIAKIQGLVGVAKDLSQSTQTRKNAITELQKEYPGYLANINLENINSQEASNAINLLSAALTRKAKVQAVSNLLTKANEELTKAQTQSAVEQAGIIDKLLLKVSKGGVFAFGAQSGANKAKQGAIDTAKTQVDAYTEELDKLLAQQAEGNDFELMSPTKLKKKAEKDASVYVNAFIKGRGSNVTAIENGKFINNEIQKGLDSGPLLKIPAFDFDKTDIAKKAEAVAATINSAMANVAVGIGETIGNLFKGEGNPFASFMNVLGEGLKSIGKQLIEIGLLAVTIKRALSFLLKTPALAVAAGVAAVALGTLLTSKAKNIKAFATGGVVTSPTLALVGEQGPERITPLGYEGSANNIMKGEVVFQISGQNLRGILRRADNTAFYTT